MERVEVFLRRSLFLLFGLPLFFACGQLGKSPGRSLSFAEEPGFVFTSHSMLPQAEGELASLLERLHPDTIFVEISPEDLRQGKIEGYPLEMRFALRWAEGRAKKVFGFDCAGETLSAAVPEDLRKANIARYLEFRRGRDWKDLNDPSVARAGIALTLANHDARRLEARRACMKENILRALPEAGAALVLTGGFHSEYFRAEFPGARFPLTPEH